MKAGDRGDGSIFRNGRSWWISYYHGGKRHRETGGDTPEAARKKLKARMKQIARDEFVGPIKERLTVEQLCDNLITDLETRGAKAVPSFKSHLKPVRAAFGTMRASHLTTEQIERFIQDRQAAGVRPATINRETGALRQALRLAVRTRSLAFVPYFPMLDESDNVRRGFFEPTEFAALVALLPEPVSEIARFAYLTGWRKGEILSLTWDRVDRTAREAHLSTSKNGDPRAIAYDGDPDLEALIDRRWTARQYETADGQKGISAYVFHREGRPLVDIRDAWAKACREARLVKPCGSCNGVPAAEDAKVKCRRCEGHGVLPGRLFHDFRRTAGRDMVRGGVPETVAMRVTGHKTRAMFDRYNITSTDDIREAQRRTREYRASRPKPEGGELVDMPGRQREAS
jgi:integrase